MEGEEDMEPVEAIELAVKKRKYIIQKATGMLDDELLEEKLPPPSMTGEETEEEQGEEKDNDNPFKFTHGPYQFKIPKPVERFLK